MTFRTTAGCTESGGLVTCNLGNLAAGATATQTINVTAPGTTGTIRNFAGVRSANFDPDTNNNRSNATTTVNQAADLSITKADTPDPVTFGGEITYTMNVSNSNAAGTANATNVQVTDPLPANTTFVSATPSRGSCPTPPNPGDSSGTVTCDLGTINA